MFSSVINFWILWLSFHDFTIKVIVVVSITKTPKPHIKRYVVVVISKKKVLCFNIGVFLDVLV